MAQSLMRRSVSTLLVLLFVGWAPNAAAQDAPGDLDWGYLVDGGALPFFWGSATVAVGSALLLSPPDSPRLFSDSEGGRGPRDESIPNYQVGILAGITPLVVAIPATPGRLYHAKGAAEAVVTTAALTEFAKNVFGRHRPSYQAGSDLEDDRKSFFSGHASLTLASTTYVGLYLHQHVFARWRGERSFAWWEAPPLAGLAALAVYVPYTRVHEHKHHLSDVLVGAGIGTSLAVGFYLYQESRFGQASRRAGGTGVMIVPNRRGVALQGSW